MKTHLQARLLHPYEHKQADQLYDQLHYLGSTSGYICKTLRYVVETKSGEWAAILDFGYASLSNRTRKDWVGWDTQQEKQRLKYVLNNTRFLVLPHFQKHHHCIASQALSLVSKRLSDDWSYHYGHPILLLETFVRDDRAGTCYKAANWQEVGQTSGYGKRQQKYYYHGERKRVFLYPLHRKTKQILSARGFPHPILTKATADMNKIDLNSVNIGSLTTLLEQFPDPRSRQGRTYTLPSVLALLIVAMLSGESTLLGVGEYAKNLDQDARTKLGFTQRPPRIIDESSIRKILYVIDTKTLIEIAAKWMQTQVALKHIHAIAIDGKTMQASRSEDGSKTHILSALDHDSGVVLAQCEVGAKTNEIPEALTLLRSLNLRRKVVTMDAMHTQKKTAKCILDAGGDYLLPVKNNQPSLLKDIEKLPKAAFSPCI